MTKLDQSFFDEYKHLDKLLSDCYMTEGGVTPYIDDMLKREGEGKNKVQSWQRDLKELKHLRYLRNKLAHETEGGLAEQKDIDSVKEFQVRITNGDDPLARLEKELKKSKKETKKPRASAPRPSKESKPAPRRVQKQLSEDKTKLPVLLRVIFAQLTVITAAFIIAAAIMLILTLIK